MNKFTEQELTSFTLEQLQTIPKAEDAAYNRLIDRVIASKFGIAEEIPMADVSQEIEIEIEEKTEVIEEVIIAPKKKVAIK